jgi:acetyl esterase/lipase
MGNRLGGPPMLKRILLVTIVALLVLGGGGYAFYRLSPWPSVWLIRHAFAKGDEAARADAAAYLPKNVRAERGLVYDAKVADGRFDVFVPTNASASLPAILWVHGGGFVAGSREGVGNYLQLLASRGYIGIAIDYTRAPTAKFPTPVAQTNAALSHIIANAAKLGIDPTRIFLMGDSAGANIVAQTALAISDPAYARRIGVTPGLQRSALHGVILHCGPYNPALLTFNGPFGDFNRVVTWSYFGISDPGDRRLQQLAVTPLVTASFPPSFISVGNADPLAPHSVELAKVLRAKGVEVDGLFFAPDHEPPLGHEYQMMVSTDAGQLAFNRTVEFLDSHSR